MIYLIKKTYFKVGPNGKKRVWDNHTLNGCADFTISNLLFGSYVADYKGMALVKDEPFSKTFVNNMGDFINLRLRMQQYCPNKHYRCF